MKKIYGALILCCLLTAITSCSTAQQKQKVKQVSRDSIITKYLKNGAYLFPIYSQSWNIYIDSALMLLPQDAYLWQQKAMPYFKKMKYDVGLSYLDSAVKYDLKRYIDYRGFINCIFKKDYRSAINDFNLSKNANGDAGVMDHEYNFYIGLSYLQLNKFDSAGYYFNTCIERQEKLYGDSSVHHLVNFYMGIALYEQGNYTSAIEYFDKSLVKYTSFSDAKFYKSLCIANLRRHKEALKLMLEAQNDLKNGYTINEDNAIYERYPYQISNFLVDNYIESVNRIIKVVYE
ncbi:tetratricopeptide repeat protein [Chitinophaga sp. Cy-1792]|uniref:tetratricopeptide repeat protein n=1 Tax=Chitinophaga sp. Cy-1792 TaxID=2608339 RepID=UPI001421C0AC|nr:tetratricopeptide repeat protein [Chitinophaga sp. Cy-1792]